MVMTESFQFGKGGGEVTKSINMKSFQPALMTTFMALRSYISRRDCMS
jgi:hypothetical protein